MALLELTVRDLAVIERARVSLSPGLTVITGETGAGKSLLIDALSLVMGGRADSSMVRHGAQAARVEALFDRDPEPLICVREVGVNGRSICRLDDETVTATRLAAEIGPLVEIHGQHDQQRLLQAAWQRDVLDAYGDHERLRSELAQTVRRWRENEAALRELAIEPAELARRMELAEHAADEIEAAGLQAGEIDQLKARLATLANAGRIRALLSEAVELLGGERGARDRVAVAAKAIGELARLDAGAAPLADRLVGLEAEVEDVALELRRRAHDVEAGGGADATAIEERLGVLYSLLRKYGPDEEAVITHGQQARAEVERLRGLDAERERRQADGELLEVAARDAARHLSDLRRSTAERLADATTAVLADLGFPGAAFEVRLEATEINESGADSVTYLLAPNPGEPARPLARIASGGELSRVALALKSILARADETPTLVFDEVDAGIGGRSADPVGRNLWRLARDHQVICVTHLAQIAAYADAHLRIDKHERDGRTTTEIEPLEGDARLHEIAQMLGGGGEMTKGALAAASELLERAASARAETRQPREAVA